MKKKREWKQIEIDESTFIPFDWKDSTPGGENLGRAEFQVCIKFNDNRVSEFWVYPVQTHLNTCWHYSGDVPDFGIFALEGLEQPWVWLVGHCDIHNTPFIRIYSPTNARYIEISQGGLNFWRNTYHNRKSNE